MRIGIRAERVVAVLLVTLASSPAFAFFEREWLDLRSTFRVDQGMVFLPEGLLADDDRVDVSRGSLRLLGQLILGEHVNIEAHVIQEVGGFSVAGALMPRGDDRFRWDQHASDRTYASLSLDRLNLQLTLPNVTIVLGRQPVSLATTYYFSPNDFFVPFAADAFFRLYKPGVDALRVDVELGEVSEISVIASVGEPLETEQISAVGKGVTVFGDVEVALLGGRVPGKWVVGGSVQGEMFEWLGFRGEGHVAVSDGDHDVTGEVSFNIDHRFESTVHARLEGYYHGGGATDPGDYLAARARGERYLGAGYTAFGLGYEFTPLLIGDSLVIVNWVDRSLQVALYATYSLLDDMEVSALVSLPFGEGPEGFAVRSEFGSSPVLVDIEFRAFF